MQMASSHTLLVPLRTGVPRAELVASCLVDRMLFISWPLVALSALGPNIDLVGMKPPAVGRRLSS